MGPWLTYFVSNHLPKRITERMGFKNCVINCKLDEKHIQLGKMSTSLWGFLIHVTMSIAALLLFWNQPWFPPVFGSSRTMWSGYPFVKQVPYLTGFLMVQVICCTIFLASLQTVGILSTRCCAYSHLRAQK